MEEGKGYKRINRKWGESRSTAFVFVGVHTLLYGGHRTALDFGASCGRISFAAVCSSPTATPIAPGDVSVSASYWRSTEFVDVHYHICLDVESGDLNFMLVHQVPYTLSHLPQLSSSF